MPEECYPELGTNCAHILVFAGTGGEEGEEGADARRLGKKKLASMQRKEMKKRVHEVCLGVRVCVTARYGCLALLCAGVVLSVHTVRASNRTTQKSNTDTGRCTISVAHECRHRSSYSSMVRA